MGTTRPPQPDPAESLTPKAAAKQMLAAIDPTTKVRVDGTASVAGRSAYELVLAPRDESSLIGDVRIAIDSETSVPLRVQVNAAGATGRPAFETAFTSVTFEKPSASVFRFSPPPGAKVSDFTMGGSPDAKDGAPADAAPADASKAPRIIGKGWTSVLEVTTKPAPEAADEKNHPGAAGNQVLRALEGATTEVSGPYGSGQAAAYATDLGAAARRRTGAGRGRQARSARASSRLMTVPATATGRREVRAREDDSVPAPSAAATAAAVATADAATAIRTFGLTKRFPGGQVAVDAVDLVVPRGSVYGFLGPNGSGKTTTIRMLLGLVSPTSGSHELLGTAMPGSAADVLPRVGALVEGPAFHPYLGGRDNLLRLDAGDRTVSGTTARERVDGALHQVGLSAAAKKRYRKYSLGMRQRLGLAAALLRERDLLVLDEPTNGLDPQGTREVRSLLREASAAGATVFVSSHLLSEIEQICTHVGVMSHGRLVFQGSLPELRARAGVRIRVETSQPQAAADVLSRLGTGTPELRPDGVVADLGQVASEQVTAQLVSAGIDVRQLVVERPDLEDVFVALTGEGFDVDE